jgi:LmbE family N-acetylglucosaminyl deacetylase
MSVLVLAPHADDAEFGVGGYLRRLTRGEQQVRVVVFAYGDYRKTDGTKVEFETRKQETFKAMEFLGVEDCCFVEGMHENWGDRVSRCDMTRQVEKVIEDFYPEDLFVCLPSFNQDHESLFSATVTALRPGRFDGLRRVFAYEYPGNCWGPHPPQHGRCYMPLIDTDAQAKINALNCHQSQFSTRDHRHATPAGASTLMALRGSECGVSNAELVYLLRAVV